MIAPGGVTAFAHGWAGLALGYAAVAVPLASGMIRRAASARALWLAPLVAAPVTVAAGAAASLAGPVLSALGVPGLGRLAAGVALSAVIGYSSGRLLASRRESAGGLHYRGALVTPPPRPEGREGRSGARHSYGVPLTLAGVAVEPQDETKHFKLLGTTGTGKSTAMHELLEGALKRGDRAIIADPDGGYLRRFYDARRGDVILNPFEQRSIKWDLFAEINDPYDVEQLARSLIPDHEGADRSWRGYARTFFTAVTRQAHAAGVRDVAELYRLLVVAKTDELRLLVGGTPAQPFLEEHNVRMFDSIRSVTSSAVGALEHIARQRASAFSVRAWVRERDPVRPAEPQGVLFIPYRAGQIAALRSQISAWMRLAIFEAMNGAEGDRRLWFVIDELDALGQIDGLKDALARLRKFGGRCALGFQSVAQVSSTYGDGDAHTIVENCGNTLILRCSASEGGGTSRFASRLIGEREVLRTTQSVSRRSTEWMGSSTRSEHFATELALLPSEIEQLPDLAGLLKMASRPYWMRVKLEAHAPQSTPQREHSLSTAWRRWREAAVKPHSVADSATSAMAPRGTGTAANTAATNVTEGHEWTR
jgi:type IV secretory pathway TraG/TraD family ATPase VirD4